MANKLTDAGASYNSVIGFIYVFNLIVGTGALTMPKAFESAGWLLSLIAIIVLAAISYITVTFVIEAMASGNAMLQYQKEEGIRKSVAEDLGNSDFTNERLLQNQEANYNENTSLLRSYNLSQYYDLTERVEMGQMASLFFNKLGRVLFYICICVYLYGDLVIYCAAVPKSLRDLACTYSGNASIGNMTLCNISLSDSDPCWSHSAPVSRTNAYRIFLAVFILLMGPFVFFDVQKTKYLQVTTGTIRLIAFSAMIVLACMRLARVPSPAHPAPPRPPVARFAALPTLFGVCVYSFMCHHSLPSLVTPLRNKRRLSALFFTDYVTILAFYALVSLTAVFAFPRNLRDLYTLTFEPSACAADPPTRLSVLQYFLALFPVFVLSTNFPIIGVTLRNNLRALASSWRRCRAFPGDRVLYALLAVAPPALVAFLTDDLETLVGVTGSYAGAAIQYVVPAALVYASRRQMSRLLGAGALNRFRSPFRHSGWLLFMVLWAVLAIVLVTVNHIINRK